MTVTQRHQEKFSFIRDRMDCGWFHIAAILDDGTCIAHGNNEAKQCDISNWSDIVKIKCGPLRTVGLKKDGTVVSTKGDVFTGGRIPGEGIESFNDITDIACGMFHTVGLKYDGTVMACGFNDDGQCNVEDWQNVKNIYAAANHTIALCYDGSLLYCGGHDGGALHLDGLNEVKTVFCGLNDTVVITSDNKVYRTDYHSEKPILLDINGEDVVSVAFSVDYYLLLKADGTVVPFGSNDGGQLNVNDWHGILDISCGRNGAVGLSNDTMWTSQQGDLHSVSLKGKAVNIFGEKVSVLVAANGAVMENGTDYDDTWKLFECVPTNKTEQKEMMKPAKQLEIKRTIHKQGSAWTHLQKYGYLRQRMAGGIAHTAAIMYNDQLRICGANGVGQCDLDLRDNMKAVVCTGTATIGLKNDGSVIYSGNIPVDGSPAGTPISKWPSNIVALSACIGKDDHVLGLSSNGRVFAFGGNESGQCNVETWSDVVEIATAHGLSVGVRKDGTVITCGADETIKASVAEWSEIEHIYTGLSEHHLVGLKYDGTVVTTNAEYNEVLNWHDIIDIVCDMDRIAGIKGIGTVNFAGDLPSQYKRQGKQGVLAISSKCGIVSTLLPNGKTVIDNIGSDGEIETSELDFAFVAYNSGFFHIINAVSDGSLFVAPMKETQAPLDQTDGWKMFSLIETQPSTTHQTEEKPTVKSDVEDNGVANVGETEINPDVDLNDMSIYDSIHSAYTSDTAVDDKHADDYIATCVFKSYDCPEVRTLRRYRDMFLASSWHGRLTVKAYYFLTPLLVRCLKNASRLNDFFLRKLTAKVQRLNANGIENTEYEDKDLF